MSAVIGEKVAWMSKGYVLPNIWKNTDWAVKCFGEWVSARVQRWTFGFVAKVRNRKGAPYLPRFIQ